MAVNPSPMHRSSRRMWKVLTLMARDKRTAVKRLIRLMSSLEESGLLAHDDYSLTVLDCRQTKKREKTHSHAEHHALVWRKKHQPMNLKMLQKKKYKKDYDNNLRLFCSLKS